MTETQNRNRTGWFDNKETMRRELWDNGELVWFIDSECVKYITESHKDVAWSKCWGHYPDVTGEVDNQTKRSKQ